MTTVEPNPPVEAARTPGLAWLPYVAPMATFLVLTTLEGYLPKAEGGKGPSPTWYPIAYACKAVIVTIVLIACRSTLRDLRPGRPQ